MQCDFKYQSSKSAQVKREECSEKCSQTIDCTHFVWTKYKGGTCWMKSGNVSPEDAFKTGDKTMLCGILSRPLSVKESNKANLNDSRNKNNSFNFDSNKSTSSKTQSVNMTDNVIKTTATK